jgi:AcrR family transcriptional regulator
MVTSSKRQTPSAKVAGIKKRNVQPRGELVVNAVLEIAVLQLAENGYERLSIPQIAQLAGVNKTSIYRRWPSKLELVRDALQAAMHHTEDAPQTDDLRSDLVALAQGAAAFMQSPVGKSVVRILLSEGSNPKLRQLSGMAYQEAGSRGPWKTLASAAARGELKRDVDPSLLLFTIAGALMHRVFVEQQAATDAYVRQVVDLVLSGAKK